MSAPKIQIPGIEHVQTLEGVSEYTLKKNGLRILLAHNATVPIAGCMITYHVGSRNENPGYTGATHLLEHLMFKDSEKFNKKDETSMDHLLEEQGALLNATTWVDRTNYYAVVPEKVLPLVIEIEADRMRTARFSEQDKASEMPVVRNEYEQGEDQPMQALDKAVWAAAYVAHPYRYPTIGWKSDIENISVPRLRAFYNEFYWPNNATLTIAGSFDTVKTLKTIKKFFGIHGTSPRAIPEVTTVEPPQEGERRVSVRRAGAPGIQMAYHIPHAHHEDIPALVMLSQILAGDKTSRLYKLLIDTALATSVDASCYQLYDPSLFILSATLTTGTPHAVVEKNISDELERIAKKGVTASELTQAKFSARVYLARRHDGPFAFLSAVNEDIATGDWTRFFTMGQKYKAVTSADIVRVVKTYFTKDTATIGWLHGTNI